MSTPIASTPNVTTPNVTTPNVTTPNVTTPNVSTLTASIGRGRTALVQIEGRRMGANLAVKPWLKGASS
ncbi:hypothetical protein [Rubripirellula lacrimiformis]|uniref:hypothetical protein n=1 Tax=Rubripirellula lacrimiformis TaxID=1930273 RepID=UPI001FE6E2EE|nr:hypothetical protein [Rubripirellula lacrimiformis]